VTNFPNQENTLAAQQFAISKQLDPNDPTPWLYDAIRLQSENRPVEALRNVEKSIELNDNRAVYRSRELLDQDRAARGTSLARIYNDLGFQQLGINEATKSLSLDPGNAGAHRFLSDVYATQPRREIARVSELLQAQLLQDININPVQPSLSVTNLNIITGGGPARTGFNEFTPLFERNQAQLNLSGIIGSDWTRGEEAVVSGIYDNVSVSAGQFHYETDGFRKNNHLNYDIYVFSQAALTPQLNVQAEVRRLTTENGFLALDYDPDAFSSLFHQELNQNTARVGVRYSPTPQSNCTRFGYLQ
jgi:tetratricopeptide (TPR) repeat protein